MSFKVVEKVLPDERVGVVVRVDGKPQVIEYSDLPSSLGERQAAGWVARAVGGQHCDSSVRA